MATYTCPVCEGIHSDSDVMSTTCGYCNKRVCIYCTDFDPIINADICDKCADAVMFNPVETHCNASLPDTEAK